MLIASGCGELTRLRLVGTWEADLASANVGTFGIDTSNSESPFRNVVNTFVKNAAQSVADQVNAKERLQLNRDGTFTATATVGEGEVASAEGTWQVVKSESEQIEISLTYASNNKTSNLTLQLVGDNQFKAPSLFGGTASNEATFKRVKP